MRSSLLRIACLVGCACLVALLPARADSEDDAAFAIMLCKGQIGVWAIYTANIESITAKISGAVPTRKDATLWTVTGRVEGKALKSLIEGTREVVRSGEQFSATYTCKQVQDRDALEWYSEGRLDHRREGTPKARSIAETNVATEPLGRVDLLRVHGQVSLTAAMFLALVIGVVASTREAVRAHKAELLSEEMPLAHVRAIVARSH